MAGRKCPKCNQLTFFVSGGSGECKKCGCKMTVPPNEGKGGKGKKCLNCGRFTVFKEAGSNNSKCNYCGAYYK
ncbi:MAG: hypothetical protein K2N34_11725 [Lachnospiraceae bacterium]|nr:hypothetical protein [Lachnospiraceae bacterium]